MTCEPFTLPNGVRGIMCSRGRRWPKCGFCKKHASVQCDYPKPKKASGTCDKHLCTACAIHLDGDRDVCPTGHKPPLGPMPLCAGCREPLAKCAGLDTCHGHISPTASAEPQLKLW